MEGFYEFADRMRKILEVPLIKLGSTSLTLWLMLYLVLLVVLLFFFTGKLRIWLIEKVFSRTRMEPGVSQATGSIIRYSIIAIGFVIILQTAGIDLTTLNVLAGAVGIGVGIGLQDIVNNFISGLIILFERPIKVGDRIVVGDVEGDVISIGSRSTTVVTDDNITIIVPNSRFITENVVNWSHNDRKVRFRIPVTVAYGSDVQLVERLLVEAAVENHDILQNPPPGVRLMGFGDHGLDFELRAWSTTLLHRSGLLVSSLNYVIYRKFTDHGIEIPYPRRDVRILS